MRAQVGQVPTPQGITRIRWIQGVKGQWYGHVDSMDLRFGLFTIWPWGRGTGPWEMDTRLPGYQNVKSDSASELKALAETQLAEFVASLGAEFKAEASNAD